jgi:hypothetical protein
MVDMTEWTGKRRKREETRQERSKVWGDSATLVP